MRGQSDKIFKCLFVWAINFPIAIAEMNEVSFRDEVSYELSKFTVTALETPFSFNTVSLEDSPKTFRSASEVLQSLSPVFIQQSGESIQASVPITLGSENAHTRIVFDGIELNTQLDGTQDLSLIDLNVLKGVSVSNGPLSTQWGSSLGGVVFLSGKDARVDDVFSVSGTYGRWDSQRFSLTAPFKSGNTRAYFIPSYQASDGYMNEGEAQRQQYFFRSQTFFSDHVDVIVTGSYSEADIHEYSIPVFFRKSHLDSDLFFGGIQLRLNPKIEEGVEGNILLNGFSSKAKRDFNLLDNDSTFLFSSVGKENRIGLRSNIVWRQEHQSWGSEFNWDKFNMESSSFEGSKKVDQGYISFQYERNINATFKVMSSLRLDSHNAFDEDVSGQIGGIWEVSETFRLKFMLSSDFNTPPLSYVFTDQPERLIKPSENLNPERAETIQISFEKIWQPHVMFQLTLFTQEMHDGFILVQDTDGLFFYQNQADLVRQGIIVNVIWDTLESVRAEIGASYNEVRDDIFDEPILGRGRLKYTAAVDVEINERLNFNFSSHYIWWDMPDFFNSEDRNVLCDMALYYKINSFAEVKISVHNVFDSDLYWIDLFPNPPRNVEVGFKFVF